jgi:hypothetical protein
MLYSEKAMIILGIRALDKVKGCLLPGNVILLLLYAFLTPEALNLSSLL